MNAPVLNSVLPADMHHARALHGVQPAAGLWLRVDEAYAGQMSLRERLLSERRAEVLHMPEDAREAAEELFDAVLAELPGLGFEIAPDEIHCPDGRAVPPDRSDPLGTLGRLVQSDLCLLHREGGEHVLKAAVLCFPSSWLLAEKAGQPLSRLHVPVPEYDDAVARRVQRLFDGVQPGRPLWRFNQLWHDAPDLFLPKPEQRDRGEEEKPGPRPFLRSERQTILRLPRTRWVVFSIHTCMLPVSAVPFSWQENMP